MVIVTYNNNPTFYYYLLIFNLEAIPLYGKDFFYVIEVIRLVLIP